MGLLSLNVCRSLNAKLHQKKMCYSFEMLNGPGHAYVYIFIRVTAAFPLNEPIITVFKEAKTRMVTPFA